MIFLPESEKLRSTKCHTNWAEINEMDAAEISIFLSAVITASKTAKNVHGVATSLLTVVYDVSAPPKEHSTWATWGIAFFLPPT